MHDLISPCCLLSGVDFEHAFINSLRKVFPDARIIGCLFHLKQAWRRKLKDLGVPNEVVSHLMRRGHLDLLTVLPIEDVKNVESMGPVFVHMLLETTAGDRPTKLKDGSKVTVRAWFHTEEGSEKMNLFWGYADRQWFTKKGMPELWNLRDLVDAEKFDIDRTNCALEGFNGEVNKALPTHANLCVFVIHLDQLTEKRVTILQDVAAGRNVPPEYADTPYPVVPAEYDEFEMPSLEHFTLTGARKSSTIVPAEESAAPANGKSARSDDEPTGFSPAKKSAKKSATTAGKPAAESADAVAAPVRRKSKRVAEKKKGKKEEEEIDV